MNPLGASRPVTLEVPAVRAARDEPWLAPQPASATVRVKNASAVARRIEEDSPWSVVCGDPAQEVGNVSNVELRTNGLRLASITGSMELSDPLARHERRPVVATA